MKILVIAIFLGVSFTLTGCSPQTMDSKYVTPESNPVETETLAPLPSKTPTATPAPLEGRLFFDMNGSGLRDEATFQYDTDRFTDEKQPLQPDLLAVVKTYLLNHPELKTGDLITIEEPWLTGFSVCASSICDTTDADGKFSLHTPTISSNLTIKDPNAGTPALEMRYINEWIGPVTVPDYVIGVNTSTMNQLKNIPSCDNDVKAQVCKSDEKTLRVREQRLNDTNVTSISNQTYTRKGEANQIGLLQGFLTLPFSKEQVPNPYIFNYFDIIGKRVFDDVGKTTFFNSQDGVMLNFNGQYSHQFSPSNYNKIQPTQGVGDSHTGQDYLIPIGSYILSSSPTAEVWYLANQDGELRVDIQFRNPINQGYTYSTDYGHLTVQLVDMSQTVYRGQIVGLSGNTGTYSGRFPQLHLNFQERISGGWKYIDMYRFTVLLDPKPIDFWGSDVSWWSSDNNPLFPLVNSLK
jgi:murein DD-endopeptidase MepM/ murein hydrolase activator NlpD